MKEQYISPEAKLTCFAAVENLAADPDVSLNEFVNNGAEPISQELPGDLGWPT